MGERNPRVDAYIAAAQPFAQPILRHLRELVHTHCEDVFETIKWGVPHFERRGVLCHMAAFKRHCAFGFRMGELVLGKVGAGDAMGQFGRVGALSDLPPDVQIGAWVRKAIELDIAGVKAPKRVSTMRKPPSDTVPEDLATALAGHAAAASTFAALPPSHRREYVEWITEAKQEATRQRRLAQVVEGMAEGKTRNWKYERC